MDLDGESNTMGLVLDVKRCMQFQLIVPRSRGQLKRWETAKGCVKNYFWLSLHLQTIGGWPNLSHENAIQLIYVLDAITWEEAERVLAACRVPIKIQAAPATDSRINCRPIPLAG